MFRKIVQLFYTAYVVGSFLISLFFAFPFFLLISIGNNAAARKAIYTIIKYWARLWLWLIGMPIQVKGIKPAAGRYVIVANHISYLDTLVIFPGLPVYFRPLGKIEISKIPVLGFVYRQIVVMVDRDNDKSRALSMRLMWRALQHEGSILIFPEGTFNETGAPLKEFYNGAFRLAINTQTPILPVLFPDTVNRWHYSAWWKLWPGRNRVVYLEPVSTTGLTLKDLPALKQAVYSVMEDGLKYYHRDNKKWKK
jgi:1-acyl-sn-glycerol-3-phosphate acyltransferase